jgi:hypothetical protein
MAVTTPTKDTKKKDTLFLFDKTNYYIMFAGLALILLGFVLMAGGKSTDPHVFNKEEIYSFRRITLAPILIIAGFVVEVVAIMRKPKAK